jgi:ABC-type proline/glycine betaine transport system permease subunit
VKRKVIFTLDLLSDILGFITNGSISGIPTLVFMAIPFILGLIIGFLVKKFLKWAIIAGIILVALAYFGVWGLSFETLENWAFT